MGTVRAVGRGITIVEALVAIVVLTVGVLALVGSSALVSRMIGRGRAATVAGQVAATRIERLHEIAVSSVPPCTSVAWRSDSAVTAGVSERWQILDPAGAVRRFRVVVESRRPGGRSSDTVVGAVLCGSP
jgi:hypothetical protein